MMKGGKILLTVLATGFIAIFLLFSASYAEETADSQPQGILHIPDYGDDLANRTHLSGDWGGKRSSSGPIMRFKNPRDFISTYEAAQRPLTRMVFLCKEGTGPDYISDRDLHRRAASCE